MKTNRKYASSKNKRKAGQNLGCPGNSETKIRLFKDKDSGLIQGENERSKRTIEFLIRNIIKDRKPECSPKKVLRFARSKPNSRDC